MTECVAVEEVTTDELLQVLLICNVIGCGHASGPSQPLVCDCCNGCMEEEIKQLMSEVTG